jgi:hypothetical protein
MGTYIDDNLVHACLLLVAFTSERPEDSAGVGGQEGRRLLDYIKERCGKLE